MDVEVQLFSGLVLLSWFKLLDYLTVYRQFARLIVILEVVCLPRRSALMMLHEPIARSAHTISRTPRVQTLRQMFWFLVLLFIVLAAFSSAQ